MSTWAIQRGSRPEHRVGKMLLVALFFMHVRHSTQLTRLVVAGGLLWLAILITLTMADIVTRGWIGVPGR